MGLKLSTQWTSENPKCYVWSWIQPNLPWTSSRNEVHRWGFKPSSQSPWGTSSVRLHIQKARSSPLQTTPPEGWPVAFGGLWEYQLDASQPFRGASCPVSNQPPSPPVPGEVEWLACAWPSFFLSAFLIYLYQCMSGKLNCCYFHLEQANKDQERKRFFSPFSLNLPTKIK